MSAASPKGLTRLTGRTLHVRGVKSGPDCESRLREIFGSFGAVEEVTIRERADKESGADTSWALVKFERSASMEKALRTQVSVRMDPNRPITIGRFSEKQAKASTGGMGKVRIANKERDLEHLFGGSDLSTAVKALYESGAPQEFFQLAERFIRKKDKEIEDVCSTYYHEFIESNRELLGIRGDIREIKVDVVKLNEELQAAGQVYLGECERLIELRQMRHNVDLAKTELGKCVRVLTLCARTSEQIQARKFYHALMTLRQLEVRYLPFMVAEDFKQDVQDRIPGLRAEIRTQVLSEFTQWLSTVAETTSAIGEYGLAWNEFQMERRSRGLSIYRYADEDDDDGGGGGGSFPGGGDDSSFTSSSSSQRRRSTVTSTGWGGSDTRRSTSGEDGQGGGGGGVFLDDVTVQKGLQEDRTCFEVVGLSFQPLYMSVHIFDTLKELPALREAYRAQRRQAMVEAEQQLRAQMDAALTELSRLALSTRRQRGYTSSGGDGGGGGGGSSSGGYEGGGMWAAEEGELFASQFAEQLGLWLKQLSGFFIMEDTIQHDIVNEGWATAASSSSGSGGGPSSPTSSGGRNGSGTWAEALWAEAMGQLRMVMRRGFAQLAHAPRWMLTLKRTVENFVGLLGEWHGYYVVPLFQELERTQEQYEAALLAMQGDALRHVLVQMQRNDEKLKQRAERSQQQQLQKLQRQEAASRYGLGGGMDVRNDGDDFGGSRLGRTRSSSDAEEDEGRVKMGWEAVTVRTAAEWEELIAPHVRSLYRPYHKPPQPATLAVATAGKGAEMAPEQRELLPEPLDLQSTLRQQDGDGDEAGAATVGPEEVAAQLAARGGLQLPFSVFVPTVMAIAKATIEQYALYAHEWPEYAARLTTLLQKLLGQECRRALAAALPVERRSLAQAVQLSADMVCLQGACCHELEDAIRSQLQRDQAASTGLGGATADDFHDFEPPELLGGLAPVLSSEQSWQRQQDEAKTTAGRKPKQTAAEAKERRRQQLLRPLEDARRSFRALQNENEDLVMQLMDEKLSSLLSSPASAVAGGNPDGIDLCAALSGSGSGSGVLALQLGKISGWFKEVLGMMEGVLEPALLDGAFFAALSTLNNRIVAAFTNAALTKTISLAAVHSLAEGLDTVRSFAVAAPVESLALLLDQAQQLIALVVQADAWVEAVCANGSAPAGAPEIPSPDEEGGFLHADVRAMILPRLSLETIASVLERLAPRGSGAMRGQQESRASKVRRQGAESAVKKRARELAKLEVASEPF